MADLSEELFEAIGIIAKNLVNDLQYDKTIICTITDTSKANEGKYTVSNGSVEFEASSDKRYIINTPVYVTIYQNGDKAIIGKYTDANKAQEYIKPSDRFINMIDVINVTGEKGIIANGNKRVKLIKTIDGKNYSGYDRMVVSANFTTGFQNIESEDKKPVSGDYGLEIQITGTTETPENTYLFNSDDMYGNVYSFIVGNKQEKMFDISNFKLIQSIKVSLYQAGNFKDIEGNEIDVAEEANIFASNVNVSFGYALEKYTEDSVILYTTDEMTYSTKEGSNKKTLKMHWAHLNQSNLMVSIDKNDDPQLTDFEQKLLKHIDGIKWYRWKFENDIVDTIAGAFWEEMIDNSINYFEKRVDLDSNNLPEERFKVIIQFYTNEDLIKIEEKIKDAGREKFRPEDESTINAILDEYQKISYQSDVIIFTNLEDVEYKAAVDMIRGLEITTNDLYHGIYNIYGEDGTLINQGEANKLHQLIAMYKSIYADNAEFDGNETIEWYFPRHNTMIVAPALGKEYSENEEFDNSNPDYYIIKYEQIKTEDLQISNSAGDLISKVSYQTFRLGRTYSQTATNNTIICKVYKNGRVYTTNLQLIFGTSGTQGTHYTLSLNPVGDETYIKSAINSQQSYEARLQGYDGEFISDASFSFTLKSNAPFNKIQNGSVCALTTTRALKNSDIYILTVTTTYDKIQLQAQYPIMINFKPDKIDSFEGATKIVYDSYGVNPTYYKNPYRLFKQFKQNGNQQYEEVSGLSWSITPTGIGLPSINNNNENNNIIKPASFFVTGAYNNVAVVAKKGNETYFLCPLIIIQNRYGNSLINEWNGDVKVDEENNFIGAATIAAGKKDSNNTFTGVVLGEDTTAEKIGLYGYQQGAQSFGFREDGTAFIGKSGSGRIEFDGEKGIIESSLFKTGTGLQIDLDSSPYLTIKENNNVLFQSASNGTTIGNFVLEKDQIRSSNDLLILQSSGDLIAKAGLVGNWKINENSLSSERGGKGLILSPSSGIQVGTLTPGTKNQLFANVNPELVVARTPVSSSNINKYVIADNETDLYWQINGVSSGNYTYKKENIYSGEGFSINNIGDLTSTKAVNLKDLTVSNVIQGTCRDVLNVPWHTHSFNLEVSGEGRYIYYFDPQTYAYNRAMPVYYGRSWVDEDVWRTSGGPGASSYISIPCNVRLSGGDSPSLQVYNATYVRETLVPDAFDEGQQSIKAVYVTQALYNFSGTQVTNGYGKLNPNYISYFSTS